MSDVPSVIRSFLSAWSERDPSRAAAAVTDDVVVIDPNGRVEGPTPLVEHIEMVLRRFDFDASSVHSCFVEGDLSADARMAFVFACRMKGRSSRLAGVETGFDAAVFVSLRAGKIATWTEYWDPAPMVAGLALAASNG